jgi:hypothetical protein
MEELKAMAANGQLDSVISKMYSYTANVTVSDAYWSKRRRELEAIMQQKGKRSLCLSRAVIGQSILGEELIHDQITTRCI